VFDFAKLLQGSLMFAGKDRSLPIVEYYNLIWPYMQILNCRLQIPIDKHSSLLCNTGGDEEKSFINNTRAEHATLDTVMLLRWALLKKKTF